MNEQIKKAYDKASILKDINDREQMIRNYQISGHLDRNTAIEKIQELRQTDEDIALATAARLAISSTPFVQIPDQGIVAELQMQVSILAAKLLQEKQ